MFLRKPAWSLCFSRFPLDDANFVIGEKVTQIPMIQAVKRQIGAHCPAFKSSRKNDLDLFEVGHLINITLIIFSQLKLLQLSFNMGHVIGGEANYSLSILVEIERKNTVTALAADGRAFFCLFGLWLLYLCSTAEL